MIWIVAIAGVSAVLFIVGLRMVFREPYPTTVDDGPSREDGQ